MFNNIFFFENRAVYEIMWKNIVEPGRPQMTVWRMRIACFIPKATNTHSACVILIVFPMQRWLQEGPLMLRYTYIACLVFALCCVRRDDHSFRGVIPGVCDLETSTVTRPGPELGFGATKK
jgi:hypothetical protein